MISRARLRIIVAIFFLAGTAFVIVPPLDVWNTLVRGAGWSLDFAAVIMHKDDPYIGAIGVDARGECAAFLALRRRAIQGEIVVVAISVAALIAIAGIKHRERS